MTDRKFTAPGELDIENPHTRGPVARRVEARRAEDHPTDTEMLDWVLPILDSGGNAETDKRVHALMAQLLMQVGGRDAIRAAMKVAP